MYQCALCITDLHQAPGPSTAPMGDQTRMYKTTRMSNHPHLYLCCTYRRTVLYCRYIPIYAALLAFHSGGMWGPAGGGPWASATMVPCLRCWSASSWSWSRGLMATTRNADIKMLCSESANLIGRDVPTNVISQRTITAPIGLEVYKSISAISYGAIYQPGGETKLPFPYRLHDDVLTLLDGTAADHPPLRPRPRQKANRQLKSPTAPESSHPPRRAGAT